MSRGPAPERVRVRMYRPGFGDAFLVSVEYASAGPDGRAARHILFDLGSTRLPRKGALAMSELAALVTEHTGGKLDLLVITHRHKDHISAFGDPDAARALSALAPKLVLRPWTEDPDLAADATGPAGPAGPAGSAGLAGNASARRFVARLTAAQHATLRLGEQRVTQTGLRRELQAEAADQVPNEEAIRTIDALAAGGRGRYLHAGSRLDVGAAVPGLKVTVLGPPTVDQSAQVATQASRDPEYWMLRLQQSLAEAVPSATGSLRAGPPAADVPPGPVRWLVEHIAQQQTHSVTRLVRALDDALNNTSLVLLLEIGGLRLLFPGDAQIENWRYTLDRLDKDAKLRAKLTGVDLYKVGHHGSRNATPRSLHALWTQRPADAPRMTALMSTLSDVHGSTSATAVPRATLVAALKQVADLYSTEDLPPEQPFVEVVADAAGGPFRRVPAARAAHRPARAGRSR